MTTQSHEQFEQHMDAIARHYRWASRSKAPAAEYALPQELALGAKGPGPAATPVQAWVSQMKKGRIDFAEQNKEAIATAASHYKQTQNADDFEKALEALAIKNKKAADDSIDRWKEEGKALAKQHPEQKGAILQLFQSSMQVFSGVEVNDITVFLANAMQTLIQWIKDTPKSIAEFFAALEKKL